ncbi:secreted RxLR effector protein 161-like [Salvia splendens]|uniref:secreted RxLR effector protein 161-like n=1 Tax=Salvia splendens TaxID=180675 RepID=UPI001C27DF37|nr:secreted RxLR effector protein 161-like [Salvia splendens]
MYCMICTRPDLAHGIIVTSRYMKEFRREHWYALKWMLRYIKGNKDLRILFKKKDPGDDDPLIGYCDSDYAANLDNRKSQTGYIFKLHGAAVSWKSTLQPVVVLSTTEAEYIALTEAVKEGIWLKGILADFGVEQKRVKRVLDRIEKDEVEVLKVGTEDNAANALTKALPVSKLEHCLRLVSVVAQ